MTRTFLGHPRPPLEEYLDSPQFHHDLAQSKKIWTRQNVFRHSAIYIYVNQVCLPDLMEIELKHSQRLADCRLFAKDLERTRIFLRCVVGLEDDSKWAGGIANRLVQKQLFGVGKQHNRFGLSPWMNTYLGYIIASSALYVLEDDPVDEDVAQDYMSYMNQAWSMMNVPDEALSKAIEFGETRAAHWPNIEQNLQIIFSTYVELFGIEETSQIWDRVTDVVLPPVSRLMAQFRSSQ